MTKERCITINQSADGKVGLHFNTPLDLTEALQIYLTGALALLNSYTPKPPALKAPHIHDENDLTPYVEAKGEIFDMFNVGVSHVLELYAPELALHPDLTTESIFDAELALLSDKYNIPKAAVKEYAAKARQTVKENLNAKMG